MAIRKDETGKRWVEMEVVLPGAPEEVWRAMATGEGNAAWFIRAEIEPRVGGALKFDFGGGVSTKGEVTRWEPPRVFGYVERDWNGDAPPVATEIVITPRAGGTCVMRMVHSMFASSDEWDDQMEGFQSGWPAFFEVLALYLKHFSGQKGAPLSVMAMTKADALAAWARLSEAFGVAGANVGERRTMQTTPERFSGVVKRVTQDANMRWTTLRLDAGIAIAGVYAGPQGVRVSTTLFFYGDDADARAAKSEPLWTEWLSSLVA